MKLSILLLVAIPLISCVGPDGKRGIPLNFKVKACYITPQGTVCAGTDGKAIVLEGNISTPNASINFGK